MSAGASPLAFEEPANHVRRLARSSGRRSSKRAGLPTGAASRRLPAAEAASYHAVLASALTVLILAFPSVIDILPVGGVEQLAEGGEVRFSTVEPTGDSADGEIVNTVLNATVELDSLVYARRLAITLIGIWLLVLPVSWVQKSIN